MDTGPNPFDKLARFGAKDAPLGFAQVILGNSRAGWNLVRFNDTRILPVPLAPERTSDLVALFKHADHHHLWAVVVEFKLEARTSSLTQAQIYQASLNASPNPAPELGATFHAGAVLVNLTGTPGAACTAKLGRTAIRTPTAPMCVNLAELSAAQYLRKIERGTIDRGAVYWIPLMHGAEQSVIIERWKKLVAAEPNLERQANFVTAGLVFSEAAGVRDPWRAELKGWNMVESKAVAELVERFRPVIEARANLAGRIQVVQSLLNLPETPTEALTQRPLEELRQMEIDIRAQLQAKTKI